MLTLLVEGRGDDRAGQGQPRRGQAQGRGREPGERVRFRQGAGGSPCSVSPV